MNKQIQNWNNTKLGDVCRPIKGVTYKSTDYAENETDGNVFLTLKSISKGGGFNHEGLKFYKGSYLAEQVVKPGDLIIANTDLTRAGDVIGAPLIVPELQSHKDYIFSMDISRLDYDPTSIDRNFLFHYLSMESVRNYMRSISNGSTVLHLKIKEVGDLSLSLPSIETQRKIAYILDSYSAQIDNTDRIIQKTEELKKGLMNELLMKGIGHKDFKKTKLGEIPESWKILSMRDICTVRQGLQIAIKQRKKEPGPNRFLYITNKFLKSQDNPDYIENPSKSVICSEDDVLMTRTGNTGEVVTGVVGVFHNNFFLVDYDRNQITKQFLIYYLKQSSIQAMILDRAGTTTIPDLNHPDFYSLPVLLPTKDEQVKIGDILASVDQKISIENGYRNRLLEIKKGLMSDIFSRKIDVN